MIIYTINDNYFSMTHDAKQDFPKGRSLNTYSAIYVPSTKAKSKPVSSSEFNRRQKETRNFMSSEFGGTTTVKGVGSYVQREGAGKGRLINERVAVVENFSSKNAYNRHDKEVQKFVEGKVKEWEQESIGYEFEDEKGKRRYYFIKPAKKKKKKMKRL